MLRYATCIVLAIGVLSGCAMVRVSEVGPEQYIAMRRGDVLSTGRLSGATRATLNAAGLDEAACQPDTRHCVDVISADSAITLDRRLASASELSLQMALANTPTNATVWSDAQFDMWLRTIRFSYGFLFLGQRAPAERAFEDRQTQVRDYYNFSVQEFASALYRRNGRDKEGLGPDLKRLSVAGWLIHVDLSAIQLPEDARELQEVIPAARLSFAGLRSVFRRDGLGAELVAVTKTADTHDTPGEGDEEAGGARAADAPVVPFRSFREMPSPNITALLNFRGDSLAQVLDSREATLSVYDPYRVEDVDRRGESVPLAGNFSAGYGVWLARSGFAGQSLRTLFGRSRGIDRPRIYLMQPFDPNRRIVLMLHGLASSPEAWVNVANELLGDETLREHFQVWQVYYPTNAPILANLARIRRAVRQTLAHFDPKGTMPASRGMVLIGHSMGGVLARLLVSTADENLMSAFEKAFVPTGTQIDLENEQVNRFLMFTPMPQVGRAIFIAAPHRGTPFANNRISRWAANLVRLPLALLQEIDEVVQVATNANSAERAGSTFHIPNSIDQLRDSDPIIQAASQLQISPKVCFHSIIARRQENGPLEDSDDGVVPYRSAHLEGARSEFIVVSRHSVQESPQAINEIRRILHEDIEAFDHSRSATEIGCWNAGRAGASEQ